MWDSEVSPVQRSPSLVLTCGALPWLLQSSYTPPPLPLVAPPPPALLTALGPDYEISLVRSGLILEEHNPRLRVTPTGIKHHNRPTYRSWRARESPEQEVCQDGRQNDVQSCKRQEMLKTLFGKCCQSGK